MMDITSQVLQLRSQGLPDTTIMQELQRQGSPPDAVQQAFADADMAMGQQEGSPDTFDMPQPSGASGQAYSQPSASSDGNIYERIEEIAESMIDEKWDELIAEVKKIVEWKESVEQKMSRAESDISRLRQDFTALHQGVLGKLETYDKRMQDVGTELSAVGKVFKDVIPEFVENVKELSHITGKKKKE